ncbi:MAG: TonB-dependent receptor [Fibrobacteria bacterium]
MPNRGCFRNTATLLCLATLAQADVNQDLELSLSDLMNLKVSVASRHSEEIGFAPGIISVITREDLERKHIATLYEALQTLPGVVPFLGGQAQPMILFRGDAYTANSNHILILIDGLPLRSELTDGPILKHLPVSAIEQIEVIRGPGSVLYGSNAFTGVVSITLRKAESNSGEVGYKGSMTREGFNQYGLGGIQILPFGGLRLRGSFQGNVTEDQPRRFLDYYQTRVGIATNKADPDVYQDVNFEERGYGVQAGLDWKGLSLDGWLMHDEARNFALVYGLEPKQQPIENNALNLRYQRGWNESWTTTLAGSRTQNEFLGTDSSFFRINAVRQNYEGTINYEWKDVSAVVGGAFLRLSGDSKAELVLRGRNTLPISPDPSKPLDSVTIIVAPLSRALNRWLGYAQAGWILAEKYRLIGGFQVNKVDDGDLDVVPRVGLIGRFTDEFFAKLLYSEAYRAPNISEMFAASPSTYGNQDLDPERAKTFDAQVGYGFGKSLTTNLTYFHQAQSDLIGRRAITQAEKEMVLQKIPNARFANAAQYQDNLGSVVTNGIEWEAKALPARWLQIEASATHTWSVANDSIDDASALPSTIAKLGFDLTLPAQLSLRMDGAWIEGFGEGYGLSVLYPQMLRSNLFPRDASLLVDTYLTWDASALLKSPKGRYVARFGVSNVLDQEYYAAFSPNNQIDAFRSNEGRRFDSSLRIQL